MWSNNDLMDPNWKPSEGDEFECAYAEWYSSQTGCPNSVQVRSWAHDLWKRESEITVKLKTHAEKLAETLSHIGAVDMPSASDKVAFIVMLESICRLARTSIAEYRKEFPK